MYKSLNERSINKFMTYHSDNGYVIVSASRAEDNEETRNVKDKELECIIVSSGWSYNKIYGGFIENKGKPDERKVVEKSYVIYNKIKKNAINKDIDFSDLRQLALNICKKYNQDSVLICEPNGIPTYYKKDGTIDFVLGKNFTIKDATQDFFSSITRARKKALSGKNTFSISEAEYGIKMPSNHMGLHSRTLKGEVLPLESDFLNLARQ